MYDPSKANAILSFQEEDFPKLPQAEDDRHEYKSSATNNSELADKIARAASGFWNSGGGLFIAGVNGHGKPDGGISLSVGRQSRRDWVDQAIARVTPRGHYIVHSIEDNGAGFDISPGNAVFLVGFGESGIGPHMAPDNRYYIRAGAHTVSASHFFVEAIHARRGLRSPMLRHVLRRKSGSPGVIQLGLVTLNSTPATDVKIILDPLPIWFRNRPSMFPLHIPIISDQFPYFFDLHIFTAADAEPIRFALTVSYFDLADRQYEQVFQVNLDQQLGPSLGDGEGSRNLERELRDVRQAVEKVADAIKSRR